MNFETKREIQYLFNDNESVEISHLSNSVKMRTESCDPNG